MKKIILILIYSFFCRIILKLLLGVKFENRNLLKTKKQFIMVANHNSHLDTVTLMAAVPSSMIDKVHPVAASDYFGKSKIKTFLSKFFINAMLISRHKAIDNKGPDPIGEMAKKLEGGNSLILFPEGTRGEPEVMQQFRRGVGQLIEKFPDIEVIPVYLEGLGKSLPKGERLLVPFNSVARFGNAEKINIAGPEDIAKELENRVIALRGDTNINQTNNSKNFKQQFELWKTLF